MSAYVARPADGVAWITGASSGLGRSLALRLVHEGWRVVATARSAEALETLSADTKDAPGEIVSLTGDVTDRARMAAIVRDIESDYGGLALAILNAGVYLPLKINDLKTNIFDRSIDVNLIGTVNCLVPAIAAMKTRERGQIAIVSSVAGYVGLPTSAAYGATKAALFNLAESLKFDLDPLGIRIQVVAPGFVDTPATAQNPFPMPHLMPVEAAAAALAEGLSRKTGFEITFPKRFTYQLKLLRLLPYRFYFPLVAKVTGWSKSAARSPD